MAKIVIVYSDELYASNFASRMQIQNLNHFHYFEYVNQRLINISNFEDDKLQT